VHNGSKPPELRRSPKAVRYPPEAVVKNASDVKSIPYPILRPAASSDALSAEEPSTQKRSAGAFARAAGGGLRGGRVSVPGRTGGCLGDRDCRAGGGAGAERGGADRSGSAGAPPREEYDQSPAPAGGGKEDFDDDIPF